MSLDTTIGAIATVAILVYLFYTLLRPERF